MPLTLRRARDLAPPATTLRQLLHDHHSRYDPHRPLDVIHASDLTDYRGFCARYYALAERLRYTPRGRYSSASEQMLYRIGRRHQDDLVMDFADMGRAVGDWRCLACDRLETLCERPEACACGCTKFEPKEIRLTSPSSGASAGFDMLFKLTHKPDSALRVTEIKTMQESEFKELKAPLAEAKWRTSLYLRIADEVARGARHPVLSRIDTKQALILYTVKGGYGVSAKDDPVIKDRFTPFKEYVISRDDAGTDDIVRRATSLTSFRKGGPMPKGICSTAGCARALKCGVVAACFSGDHPPG